MKVCLQIEGPYDFEGAINPRNLSGRKLHTAMCSTVDEEKIQFVMDFEYCNDLTN